MSETFEKEFFDAGKEESGVYRSYHFEDRYQSFKILATWIKNHFAPRRVLDVGCAKGILVTALRDIEIEALGVDISEYAISNAPENIRADLQKVDLNREPLPFENEYFDFVTFWGTIEYLNNHSLIIREINRVLRDGGVINVTTLYKRERKDKIRINIHDKDYWIKEFESNGFRFMPKETDILVKQRYEQFFNATRSNTMRFKIGRFLYQKGGRIGKEITFPSYKYFNRSYGVLLFNKEVGR